MLIAVVVAIMFPTVSCVPVAERTPEAFEVMIELIGNVVADRTCEANVEVEIVCVRPFVPVYANPCDSDDRYTDDPNVDDAVEKRPFVNPIVVPVALKLAFEVNGNTCAARVEVPIVPTTPFVPV